MKITEDFNLSKYSTMQIGGTGKFLIEIENEDEIPEAIEFAKEKGLNIYILGEGSNTIFQDTVHKNAFLKFKTSNITPVYQDEDWMNIQVDAGVNWDYFVDWSVKQNLSGIEALSLIPGSVGASPIQNIGAYGQEVSDTIINVKIYDTVEKDFFIMNNLDCQFAYRDSLFKNKKYKNRFIVINVTFRLSKHQNKIPTYKDLQMYFLMQKIKAPNLQQIRKAVIQIRNDKLPNPINHPNCGSFFKNIETDIDTVNRIKSKYPDLVFFDKGNNIFKIPTAWLMEKSGLKGLELNNFQISPKSPLVLINKNRASFQDLLQTIEYIKETINNNFELELEEEVNLV